MDMSLHRDCFILIKYFEEFITWDFAKMKNCIKDIYMFKYNDFELERIEKIIKDILQVIKLRELPLIPQRSTEWYELRTNRLTASDLAQALGKGKFGTRQQLLEKKAFPETNVFNNDLPPLKWGTMFEDMGMRCYKQDINNVAIYEFGLIPNEDIYCFGASPDGITETGIMVEMKCPYKRKCTNDIPEQYYLQIQGQLATCHLSSCDYVECYFEAYHDLCEYEIMCKNSLKTGHGIILEFSDPLKNYIYEYSPEYYTYSECIEWANVSVSKKLEENPTYVFLKMTPWRLKNIFHKRIEFDKEAWPELVELIYKFWNDVKYLREKGLCVKETEDKSSLIQKNKRTLNLKPTDKYLFIEDSDDER